MGNKCKVQIRFFDFPKSTKNPLICTFTTQPTILKSLLYGFTMRTEPNKLAYMYFDLLMLTIFRQYFTDK